MDAVSNAQAPRADLFDPASLAALGRIEIVARWIVDGFMSGLHRSPRKGFSVEFAEYRPYQPGDDLRYIDWKIAARSDRWVVRQYEEETNLRASIVLDVSKSMAWSGAQLYALAGTRAIARAAAHQARVRRAAHGRARAAAPPPARCRRSRALRRPRFGARSRRAPGTDSGAASSPRSRNRARGARRARPIALEQAARLISRRGMIVLISDLLMDIPDVERAMRGLRAAGHDVTVLHLMDPAERELPSSGEALFVDPESELDGAGERRRRARRVPTTRSTR